MNQNHIADTLRVVTYITAAKADASAEQGQRLREERSEHLEAYRQGGPEQDILDWLQDVMGPDWKPSGEHGAFLETLN